MANFGLILYIWTCLHVSVDIGDPFKWRLKRCTMRNPGPGCLLDIITQAPNCPVYFKTDGLCQRRDDFVLKCAADFIFNTESFISDMAGTINMQKTLSSRVAQPLLKQPLWSFSSGDVNTQHTYVYIYMNLNCIYTFLQRVGAKLSLKLLFLI